MITAQKELLFGGTCLVPQDVAVCPECGAQLEAESTEWDLETGKPLTIGSGLSCTEEEEGTHHYCQSDWQPVIDKVEQWCGVA